MPAFDPVTVLLEVGSKVIDRVWPDPTQAAQAKVELMKLQASGELAHMANETESLKAILADVASARERESTIAISTAPWLSKMIAPILALTIVLGGGLMLFYARDTDLKLALVGLITTVLGYYFGTSMGSTKASQLLRDMARKDAA